MLRKLKTFKLFWKKNINFFRLLKAPQILPILTQIIHKAALAELNQKVEEKCSVKNLKF